MQSGLQTCKQIRVHLITFCTHVYITVYNPILHKIKIL